MGPLNGCRGWSGRRRWGPWFGVVIAVLLFAGALAPAAGAVGPTPTITAVKAGYDHTCALTSVGGVECWGYNDSGQLGDGTTTQSSTPVQVSGLTNDVTSIAAWYHTCALTSAGKVECWGTNDSGQLGDGTTTQRLTPVPVSGLDATPIAAVTAGEDFTCALTTAGGVKCWGNNSTGQLGDGTTTQRVTPVWVSGLAGGVIAITAGYDYACAITTGGWVKCWGNNNAGQLGDGTTTQRSTPVWVNGLGSGVMAITANYTHTCAVTSLRAVTCWGYNGSGQLGDGTTTQRLTPVFVNSLAGIPIAAITTGWSDTCALTTAGAVICWGANYWGQLGNGTTGSDATPTPVQVIGLTSGVSAITAGWSHVCALATGGAVNCWGYNGQGQLGNGSTQESPFPAVVNFPPLGRPLVAIGLPRDHQTFNVNEVVSTSFSCSEAPEGPGIRSCVDSNGASSPSGHIDTSTVGAHTYTVTAISQDGLSSTGTISYAVVGPPTASVISPASGERFIVGLPAPTAFSCADAAGAPGIASCVDSTGHMAPSGALDTSTLGFHTYTVVAASSDGQTHSASISYTVVLPPAARASVTSASVEGATGLLVMTCVGYPGQRCEGTITLIAQERKRGHVIVGVAARTQRTPHAKIVTAAVPVAAAGYSVRSGQRTNVRVSLNMAGRRLLSRFYTLPTTVSPDGPVMSAASVTFAYPIATPPPDASWVYWKWVLKPCGFCYTTVNSERFFGVPKLLPTARVAVRCAGPGCPAPRIFRPGRRSIKLNGMFGGRRLGPGAVIELRITAPHTVGRIVRWTMVAGDNPRRAVRCLPPGVRKPVPCASGA